MLLETPYICYIHTCSRFIFNFSSRLFFNCKNCYSCFNLKQFMTLSNIRRTILHILNNMLQPHWVKNRIAIYAADNYITPILQHNYFLFLTIYHELLIKWSECIDNNSNSSLKILKTPEGQELLCYVFTNSR